MVQNQPTKHSGAARQRTNPKYQLGAMKVIWLRSLRKCMINSYHRDMELSSASLELSTKQTMIARIKHVEPLIIRKYVIMQNSTNWCLLHGIMDSMVTMDFV